MNLHPSRVVLYAVAVAGPALADGAAPSALPSPRPAAVPASQLPEAAGEWWVDLSEPAPADVPAPRRTAQREQVQRQQAQVARQVEALGGQVTGRVSAVRNALVVRIAPQRLPQLRGLPGVRDVRPVQHRHRPLRPAPPPGSAAPA
jgi:hypothetical protein